MFSSPIDSEIEKVTSAPFPFPSAAGNSAGHRALGHSEGAE